MPGGWEGSGEMGFEGEADWERRGGWGEAAVGLVVVSGMLRLRNDIFVERETIRFVASGSFYHHSDFIPPPPPPKTQPYHPT